MENKKTLMQLLLESGFSRDKMNVHESDLYIPVTDDTKPIVEEYYASRNLNRKWHAPIFIDQVTGVPTYNIAFGNDEYWVEKAKGFEREADTALEKAFAESGVTA